MARRHHFDEHVDDHQVELAAETRGRRARVARRGQRGPGEEPSRGVAPPPVLDSGAPWLGASLGSYLANRLGEPVAARNGR